MLSPRNMTFLAFVSMLSLALSDAKPVPDGNVRQAQAVTPDTPTSLKLPNNVVFPSTLPLVAGQLPSLFHPHTDLANPGRDSNSYLNKTDTVTGPSSLPAPLANLTLKHITVGHGIQNYTCQSNLSSTPLALGAVATLYDVTALAFLSSTTTSQIPALAASLPLTPALIPNTPLVIPGLASFPVLGFHFFASNGTPVFDLSMTGEKMFSKKVAGIKAPSNSSAGITMSGTPGLGAVDWLALTDLGVGSGSVGLKEVYRVDTAGGNPPVDCLGGGLVVGSMVGVPYSAGYYFYG